MTYEEKLLKIVNAIQEARKISTNPSIVKLYIKGLDDFDPNEIYDILYGLERTEKVLEIEEVPEIVALHAGYPPASFLGGEVYTHFLIKLLNNFDKLHSKTIPKEKKTYSFDRNRGVLTINGNNIPFKDAGRRIPYLDTLANNSDYTYHSEVAEELEGAEQVKDPQNIYYELCRGISARLIKNGITDFLEFDYNKARINPEYKKASK